MLIDDDETDEDEDIESSKGPSNADAFSAGRIVAYRECGLTFREIARRTGQNPTTFMRIWNQWVPEGHNELHVESLHPPMTNA
ncbi:hypothetical protein TNCV_642551 [Trichonephila clavipes]|nr:hypothetical protein TNCV_642551 [Trichonephila clavipes]